MITYTLSPEKKPVPCSHEQWQTDRDTRDFKILETFLDHKNMVSTVFLGMEHIGGMFEAMIFCEDEELSNYMLRCEDYSSCIDNHLTLVRKLWNARP